MLTRVVLLLVAVWLTGHPALAADGPVDFNRDIRPILSDNCFHCHGPDQNTRQADLRLDQREGLFDDRGGYAAVVPGKPQESDALRRITSPDEFERMPPADSNRRLTAEQIELLERWIQQGAAWQQHWAFVPPQRPALPKVKQRAWPRGAIDRFILARLEREGLQPSPEATKEQLLRGVTLDLTGLPPTLEEIDAFLADDAPDAYERVVDRLLASPRYGERMVWDWLDAARYADTNGYQGDPERTMWPWRDWAIGAMNQNMPFDQFTIEQLAGDLLPDATNAQVIATGFNRNHMHNGEGGRIAEESRVENVMDRAETTATVWLGLTMTCCRCHDHKYDPVSQREYYQLYAFFNNTSEDGAGRSGQMAPAVEFLTAEDETRRAELGSRIAKSAARVQSLEAEFFGDEQLSSEASSSGDSRELPKNVEEALAREPRKRSTEQLDTLRKHFQEERPAYVEALEELKQPLKALEALNRGIPRVMVMDERSPRETQVLQRGAYNQPAGDVLSAGIPSVLPPLPQSDKHDRLALARWLVDPAHPLTARVTVNRYWQMFFGTGLVKSAEDFGAQGERPSHPELLDWLATEFVRSGWDVKHMHRLIVTSATYRQSSRTTPRLLQRDPGNVLLARGPRQRLASWMMRDQALAASGLLVEQMGGPPVRPYQPPGIWAEATFGKKEYVQDHGEKLYRRSVYTFWRRIVGPTLFFDAAKRQTCTVKETRTNTPLHALTTLNDVTYVEAARALAERALTEGGPSPESRIEHAFRRVTARRPTTEELNILTARLEKLADQFAAEPSSASQLLQVGESPRNERLDPVEHAAYTALCNLILNLDESLTRQ